MDTLHLILNFLRPSLILISENSSIVFPSFLFNHIYWEKKKSEINACKAKLKKTFSQFVEAFLQIKFTHDFVKTPICTIRKERLYSPSINLLFS